jgi:hypothetical protein
VEKSMKNGKPQRVYKEIKNNEGKVFNLSMDLPREAKGKIVRIFAPKDGVPVKLGKDTEEKLKSMKKRAY